MSIKIIKTDDVDMFMQSDDFKEFQNQCDEYTKQVLKNTLDGLSETEQTEFLCWYNNQMSDDFWQTRSEKSASAILYAICRGLG